MAHNFRMDISSPCWKILLNTLTMFPLSTTSHNRPMKSIKKPNGTSGGYVLHQLMVMVANKTEEHISWYLHSIHRMGTAISDRHHCFQYADVLNNWRWSDSPQLYDSLTINNNFSWHKKTFVGGTIFYRDHALANPTVIGHTAALRL